MVDLVVQPAASVICTMNRFTSAEHVFNNFAVGFVQVQGVSATTTNTSACLQAALAACKMVRPCTTRLARMARCCARALLSSTLMVSMASSATAATRCAFCLHECLGTDGVAQALATQCCLCSHCVDCVTHFLGGR
jgi:hypothetical protein